MKSGMITWDLEYPVDLYYTVRDGKIEIDKVCLPDVNRLLKEDEVEIHKSIMEDMNEPD